MDNDRIGDSDAMDWQSLFKLIQLRDYISLVSLMATLIVHKRQTEIAYQHTGQKTSRRTTATTLCVLLAFYQFLNVCFVKFPSLDYKKKIPLMKAISILFREEIK